ncbi:MAG: hypothetical protein A3F77_10720 [Betaproteobacteria bacterium RIFCSPLOWO2_12_FULL_67_28]|nr:MAG: hypothetical protein A3F77_10720 [Betaproteobacteria bacterium RIFCSPLOWO2_12_FULL_67_28]
MPIISLSPAQQRRLEQLARDAGRTPKAMLKFVLRDGFDACDEDLRESRAADVEFLAGKGVRHGDAMRRARAAVESRARKQAA